MTTFAQLLADYSQQFNAEGFACFTHDLRDQARNFLRTGTLTGTFYASASVLARETVDVLCRLADQDANVLCEETIAARTDGYMRTLPILSVVVLSGLKDKSSFFRAAAQVLRVPRDVAQFITICKSGLVPGVRGFGGCRIKAVQNWLGTLSSYHAIKGTSMKEMTMADVVRLSHVKPNSDVQRELLGWVSGHVKPSRVSLNPQIVCLEALRLETDAQEQVRLIREGRLPYEAVVSVVASPSMPVWEALLEQAPTFNLLRNLRTFTRHGVFAKQMNVDLVVRKLSRPDTLVQARILPFQCYAAWKAYAEVPDADAQIVAALSDAIEQSVCNLPLFDGRVVIAPDVSGSMVLNYTNKEQTTSAAEVSGIFSAGLLKRCPNVRVLPFEERVVNITLNPRDSVLSNARRIAGLGGGGTALCAPIERLIQDRDKVDLFVGITDNVEWVGQGFLSAWRAYRSKIAPEAKAVLVTVVPNTDRPVPQGEPGVSFVHGWSDSVLRFVAEVSGICQGYDSIETD